MFVTFFFVHAEAFAVDYGSPMESSVYRLNRDDLDAVRLTKPDVSVPSDVPAPTAPAVTAPPLAEKPFASEIRRAALEVGLDPALVHAVIYVESGYNPKARSPKGAVGLMQVMPATAARYGISNPAESMWANLLAGTRYLRDLMLQFNNDLDLVLAAYNAGENAVRRYGQRIPPYRETQLYVPAVLTKFREWRPPLPQSPIIPVVNEDRTPSYDTRLNQNFLDKTKDKYVTSD